MLNFRNVNIFFAIAFVLLLFVGRNQNLSYGIYILFVMIFFAVQFYGCSFINSGFHIKTYCGKNTNEKVISITFDDGPDKLITPKILNVLKEYQVHAAFFCIGKKIEGNENILLRMNEEGHLIGNHSFSHDKWFDLFSTPRMTKELSGTEKKIQSVIGRRPKLFRPPYGVTNPNLRNAVKHLKYSTIGWNVRSFDTVLRNENKIFERVIRIIRPGSVILLHDTVPETELMLPKLLLWLKENKYRVTGIDEMFNLTAYKNA